MNEKRGRGFSNNRGQVTIFVILGLIIVGAAALIYFLYPTLKSTFIGITDPESFIQTCMQDEISNTITNLSLQGGTLSPKHYFLYYNPDLDQAYHLDYLCYTNQYYKTCTVQQTLLQQHIQNEIRDNIQHTANACFTALQKSYQNRGYTVNFVQGNTTVSILPQRTSVLFNDKLTLTKDTSQRYENFTVLVNNNLYELISIANSILNWEATYGDAPTQIYMQNYHDLIIQKWIQSDGTKVYILKNLNTGDLFQFASRSVVWPLGLGTNGVYY